MALTSTGMTLADLLERFGAIPAARIRYDPPPGTATEQDVIVVEDGCADRDPEVHQLLMAKVFPRQATVVSAAELVAALAA